MRLVISTEYEIFGTSAQHICEYCYKETGIQYCISIYEHYLYKNKVYACSNCLFAYVDPPGQMPPDFFVNVDEEDYYTSIFPSNITET